MRMHIHKSKTPLEQATDALSELAAQLKRDVSRAQRRRGHGFRNALIAVGGVAAILGAIAAWLRRSRNDWTATVPKPSSVDAEIEVGVPVATAYSQWTRFEEFPRFMEGIDEVKQIDETHLHWEATVAGRRAEWDARIVERDPDRRIAWESVDGKHTRGIVTFEPKGAARSRVRVHMSYEPDGTAEKVGSAIGLDSRQIHADLARFRELVESRN